jgi:hypothetical protein
LLTLFFRRRKSCAEEVRAIVPLAKDTEVHYPYKPSLRDRAERRQLLLEKYGFMCYCELCSLPDDLSNALDNKIKLVNVAADNLDRLYEDPESMVRGDTMIRALQFLDIRMSITIRERLFFDYRQFVQPLYFLLVYKRPDLLQRVGNAILGVFRRHLGTGIKNNTGVEHLSTHIEWALLILAHSDAKDYAAATSPAIEDRLERTASSIISALQSLP